MQRILLLVLLTLLFFSFVQERAQINIPEKPEVIMVKGETFIKGADTVIVEDFNIGKYEITVSQYRAFCNATGKRMPNAPTWGWNDNHPIINVTYIEALAYCEWLGKTYGGNWRLPHNQEWEYAAKGGNKRRGYDYSGSNDIDKVAWYEVNAGSQPHIVGTKEPNELGVYDMTGNVWEWCNDWYIEFYSWKNYGQRRYKIIKGGSWLTDSKHCFIVHISTYTNCHDPNEGNDNIGIRVIYSPK